MMAERERQKSRKWEISQGLTGANWSNKRKRNRWTNRRKQSARKNCIESAGGSRLVMAAEMDRTHST